MKIRKGQRVEITRLIDNDGVGFRKQTWRTKSIGYYHGKDGDTICLTQDKPINGSFEAVEVWFGNVEKVEPV